MSSIYQLLCLSHDPAISVGVEYATEGEWRSAEPALEAVRTRSGVAAQHVNCDLLVGRYSSPLVKVCCPRSASASARVCAWYHPHSDLWVDAGWLRLLALSTEEQRKRAQHTGCWRWETAHRLRIELGLEGP